MNAFTGSRHWLPVNCVPFCWSAGGEDLDFLMQKARAVAQSHFGNKIYIRGLIEIGNCCHNDCFYCGIRKSNRHLKRYRLDAETIPACCRHGYELGFRTFVLQGGEDNYMNDDRVTEVVTAIRTEFPDVAITLSLGERPTLSYERFFSGRCQSLSVAPRNAQRSTLPPLAS